MKEVIIKVKEKRKVRKRIKMKSRVRKNGDREGGTMIYECYPRENKPVKTYRFPCNIMQADVKVYRYKKVFQILDIVTLKVNGPSHPQGKEVAFNEELFFLGARLSPHPCFATLIFNFGFLSYQMNLNCWRIILGLYVT